MWLCLLVRYYLISLGGDNFDNRIENPKEFLNWFFRYEDAVQEVVSYFEDYGYTVTVVNDSSKRYIKINWGNEDETEKV